MPATISFRTKEQWYRDFSDYLTKNDLPRAMVFEDLLTVLFGAMSDENLRDFSVKGKYQHAVKKLMKAAQKNE